MNRLGIIFLSEWLCAWSTRGIKRRNYQVWYQAATGHQCCNLEFSNHKISMFIKYPCFNFFQWLWGTVLIVSILHSVITQIENIIRWDNMVQVQRCIHTERPAISSWNTVNSSGQPSWTSVVYKSIQDILVQSCICTRTVTLYRFNHYV